MRQRRKTKQPAVRGRLLLIAAAALLLIATVVLLISIPAGQRAKAQQKAVEEGVAYLELLEAKDPGLVDQVLKERREAELAAQKEELLRQLNAGELDVWSLFEDYALLGDSRAVGFSYYGFLEDSRVFAGSGDTIRKVTEHIDALKALNPSYIFLCYSINDVSIGFWSTPEEYAAEMMEVVSELNRELPDATVVISSILPATDPAFNLSEKWREIPQYSAAVESSCQEFGVVFVNNDQTAKEHMDLYGPDGIHLQTTFYPYWASNLIAAALNAGAAEE